MRHCSPPDESGYPSVIDVYPTKELVTLLAELDTFLKKLANILKGLSTIQRSW
jgi:hypothetical protein